MNHANPAEGVLFTWDQFRAARCAHRVMVAYDTPSNRRRRRLARAIHAYIPRVQQSVYQGEVTDIELRIMLKTVQCIASPEDDRLVVTPLCCRCAAGQVWIGPEPKDQSVAPDRLNWSDLTDPAKLVIA